MHDEDTNKSRNWEIRNPAARKMPHNGSLIKFISFSVRRYFCRGCFGFSVLIQVKFQKIAFILHYSTAGECTVLHGSKGTLHYYQKNETFNYHDAF